MALSVGNDVDNDNDIWSECTATSGTMKAHIGWSRNHDPISS